MIKCALLTNARLGESGECSVSLTLNALSGGSRSRCSWSHSETAGTRESDIVSDRSVRVDYDTDGSSIGKCWESRVRANFGCKDETVVSFKSIVALKTFLLNSYLTCAGGSSGSN